MFELIKTKTVEQIEQIELKDVQYESINKIYLAEKGKAQSILTRINSGYFWRSFYLDQRMRTQYNTFKEAIESRFEKKQKVYMLSNKKELKDMIKYGNIGQCFK